MIDTDVSIIEIGLAQLLWRQDEKLLSVLLYAAAFVGLAIHFWKRFQP